MLGEYWIIQLHPLVSEYVLTLHYSILSPTERAAKFATPPVAQQQDDDNDEVEEDVEEEETDAPSVFNRIGKPKNVG